MRIEQGAAGLAGAGSSALSGRRRIGNGLSSTSSALASAAALHASKHCFEHKYLPSVGIHTSLHRTYEWTGSLHAMHEWKPRTGCAASLHAAQSFASASAIAPARGHRAAVV